MTNQEALKIIKNFCDANEITFDSSVTAAFGLSISALGAIEQYKWERDIAVDQLKELGLELGQKIDHVRQAIDKQKGLELKPILDETFGDCTYACPTCGNPYMVNPFNNKCFKHCPECGQKIGND